MGLTAAAQADSGEKFAERDGNGAVGVLPSVYGVLSPPEPEPREHDAAEDGGGSFPGEVLHADVPAADGSW